VFDSEENGGLKDSYIVQLLSQDINQQIGKKLENKFYRSNTLEGRVINGYAAIKQVFSSCFDAENVFFLPVLMLKITKIYAQRKRLHYRSVYIKVTFLMRFSINALF